MRGTILHGKYRRLNVYINPTNKTHSGSNGPITHYRSLVNHYARYCNSVVVLCVKAIANETRGISALHEPIFIGL